VSWDGPPAPYRIETERLVIRCWEPTDAPLLKDALDSSLDHLLPYMVWANEEPQPIEQKADLLRAFRALYDTGESFVMGIFDRSEEQVLGGTGLHARIGPGGLEIGYWIRASATRQGIATEASAVLTRVGFEVCEADRIEIRVEPRNEASMGIPRKLGFVEEATLKRRLPGRAGGPLRDVVIFTMFREDFDASLAPGLRAFDAVGRQLI
jgi:RimJ/RimL family protein N-acetyltransferase